MTIKRYTPSQQALLAELENINNVSVIGRSKRHRHLFEYLVNRELQIINTEDQTYVPPKEIEIAIDVFGKDESFNPSEDATVRVNISNLRKKLDNYYMREGRNAPFYISIPIGDYRLTFRQNTVHNSFSDESAAPLPLTYQHAHKKIQTTQLKTFKSVLFSRWLLASLLVVSILYNVTLSFWAQNTSTPNAMLNTYPPSTAFSSHPLWADLLDNPRLPTMVVIGDIHNFVELNTKTHKSRTIIDPLIYNDTALNNYITQGVKPDVVIQQPQLKLVTKGSNIAFRNLINLFSAHGQKLSLRLSSELTAYDMRRYNIIYIGPLTAMGALAQYYQGSNFSLAKQRTFLQNKTSKQKYLAPSNANNGYVDYGILAKVNGPRNGKLFIMAGFSDAGTILTSWFGTSEEKIMSAEFSGFIKQHNIADHNNFEMLFKVPSIDGIDMQYEIIGGGKVHSNNIWLTE